MAGGLHFSDISGRKIVKGWVNFYCNIWFFLTSSLMTKRRMKCGGRKKMMHVQSHSWKFLVIPKTLVNWFRYVKLGSDLNSAGRLPTRSST